MNESSHPVAGFLLINNNIYIGKKVAKVATE